MSGPLTLLERTFVGLLTASWQAAILAMLVLGLQAMLGARLNPRWRYALWLLVLVRLVMPFQIESVCSLFRFAPPSPPMLDLAVMQTGHLEPLPELQIGQPSYVAIPSHALSAFEILAMAWLAGVVLLAALTLEVNRRFLRHLSHAPHIADLTLIELFKNARTEIGTQRSIRLVESTQVSSPAIIGLWRPTLILPIHARDDFDDAELRLIFLHELAHLKRGDVIVQTLIAVLQVVHWFNPILWLAFRRMRIDREPATDAMVLSRAGEGEKERYGLMLIKLLEHFSQRHSLATLVGILEEKDSFKRRFQLIARFTRSAYGWSLLGVVLIAALSIACLTKSKASDPQVIPIPIGGTHRSPEMRDSAISDSLVDAAKRGNLTEVERLLKQGADPSVALLPAAECNNLEVVKLLLRNGADPNKEEVLLTYGGTPSRKSLPFMPQGKPVTVLPLEMLSFRPPDYDVAKLLVEHGANTDLGMLVALHDRSSEFVKLYWEHGGRNITQLCYAISQGASVNDLQKLLDQGSPVNGPEDEKMTALADASLLGKMDVVQLLMTHGADVNKGGCLKPQNPDYVLTPIVMAASEGQDEIVEYLLQHGARPDPAALWLAAKNSSPYANEQSTEHFEDCVRLLLDAGALKKATPEQEGRIVYAPIVTRRGPPNPTVLKILLDSGANPQAPFLDGEKPNSVIGYVRELYQKNKDDPAEAQRANGIKSLLDMLEAANNRASSETPKSAVETSALQIQIDTKSNGVIADSESSTNGTAAMVNGHPIYWWRVIYDRVDPTSRLKTKYQGDELRQHVIQEWEFALQSRIWDELMVQESEAEGYHAPQADIDARVAFGVKGFGGDKQKFVENLRKNGLTLEQFEQMEREELESSHLLGIRAIDPAWKFAHDHAKSQPGSPSNKGEEERLFQAEMQRRENELNSQLEARAVIQRYSVPSSLLTSTAGESVSTSTAGSISDSSIQLLDAVQKGDVGTLRKLLDQGVDGEDSHPVYWAVYYNQPQVLKILLDHGAEATLRACPEDRGGSGPIESPIDRARRDHPELVPLLQTAIDRNHDAWIHKTIVRLTSIRVQLPAFSSALLEDVLREFGREIIQNDPDKEGIFLSIPRTPAIDSVRLSLASMNGVSAADALEAIMSAAKLTYTVDAGGISIHPAASISTPGAPKDFVRISVKVFQIGEDDYQSHIANIEAAVKAGDPVPLLRLKSCSVLSEPEVTMKSGMQGVVEAVREFPFPTDFSRDATGKLTPTKFTTRDIGVRFPVKVAVHGERIDVTGQLSMSTFRGWTQTGLNTFSPGIDTQDAYFYDEFASGQTRGIATAGTQVLDDPDNPPWKPGAKPAPPKLVRLYLFLTATAMTEDEMRSVASPPVSHSI